MAPMPPLLGMQESSPEHQLHVVCLGLDLTFE